MVAGAQVVLTTIEPKDGHRGSAYDAYEYTAHSHSFLSDSIPSVRVTFDLSPIQVCVWGGGACTPACREYWRREGGLYRMVEMVWVVTGVKPGVLCLRG